MSLPSVVWFPAMVGSGERLQQTPRALTKAPPSEITSPPLVAVVSVIFVTGAVETEGVMGDEDGSIANI